MLSPAFHQAHSNLAAAKFALGNFQGAEETLTDLLESVSDEANLYERRGLAKFCAGRFEASIDDFEKAAVLSPDNIGPPVLSYLARVRTGKDGRPQLEKSAKNRNLEMWPDALLGMFLDEVPVDSILAVASDRSVMEARSPAEAKSLRSKIRFFIAEYEMGNNRPISAVLLFEAVLADAFPFAPEYSCSRAELARISKQDFSTADGRSDPILNGNGVLWRIESASQRPSYLFGTIHVADERVLNLPEIVQEAFDRSETLAVETFADEEELSDALDLMRLQDGQTLEALIGADSVKKIADWYDVSPADINPYKPWAIAEIMENYLQDEDGHVLDVHLAQRFTDEGKQVVGLETLSEQMAAYDALPNEYQAAYLEDSFGYVSTTSASRGEQLKRTISHYLRRDLGQVYKEGIVEPYTRSDTVVRNFWNELVFARNERFVERMIPHIQQGGAFIAVGSAHLPGANGIVTLLRNKGYSVTRAY